jgi:ribosomal protein S18 acetylase RimI-like enzyme
VANLEIVFDPLPNEALARFVTDHLGGFNMARTGDSDLHFIGFCLKSPRGEWLGGLIGYIWGGVMHITTLWLSETVRRQGYGSRLMDAAEALALEHGATTATLETFTFQAPNFYAKRGYQVFGRLDGYPPGHSKLFLRKTLTPAA